MIGSLQEQAGELSLALEWGLVDLDSVVRWADENILEGEVVDTQLLDVSLAADPKSALTGLNYLAQGSDLWPSVASVLRRMLEIGDLSPEHASHLAKQIYFLAMHKDAPEAYSNLMHHWDYIDLAIDGVLESPEQATKEFIRDVSELVEALPGA